MGQVIWSKEGRASLQKIWSFYAVKNITVADKIVAEITKTTREIRFPEQYQAEEIFEKDYRRAIVRHFKIIYRVEKNNIRILQVYDTRQDPKKMGK